MSLYRYKAVSGSGAVVEGEMEARSQSAAIEGLRARDLLPIRADEVGADPAARWLSRDLFARRRVTRRNIALLTRELATLLRAGLALDRALEILIDLSANEPPRRLLARVLDRIRGGASVADAVAAEEGAFPRYYVSMVRAGEAGGTLEQVLGRLADFMDRAQALKASVRSALIYPIILLVMAGLSVVVLLSVVLPQFKPLFEDAGQALPPATRVLVAAGDAVQAYWWLMALIVAALVALARQQLSRPAGRLRWDRWVLRAPLAGDLVAKIEAARFSRTLATLLGNGVALLSAMPLVRETIGNSAIARSIDAAAGSLKEGKGLAQPLVEANLFPRLAMQLIRVGEETGRLEDMLLKVADIYDEEVKRTVDRMIALLVPLLTVFLGLLIAGIIVSILSAILSVYELPF